MKGKRYVIALLLAAVVISGVSYVSAEAHNTPGETPAPTQNPNITVTVEVGPTPHYEYINMPTELPATYTPDWKPGDFWGVISYAHVPGWCGGWGRSHKYEVVKCEVVVSNEGKQRTFYKVKKTSTHYYADSRTWTDYYFVRNDTLNTLSLYRVERHGYDKDNKTLDVDEYGTIDYPAPVMSTFMGVTLSVPVFPLTTERSEESYEFVKGRTPIRYPEPPAMTTNVWRIKQEVSVNETGYKGNGTKPLPIPTTICSGDTYKIFATTYEVTMTTVSGETVTQYWHPSAPWALYEHSTIMTVHLTGWGNSEQPEEVSVVSEENSSEWWVSEPEEEYSEPVKGVIYRKGSELAKKSSELFKGVTYRDREGRELAKKSSVQSKGVTYRKSSVLPKDSSTPFKRGYLLKN